jgi:ADP-heptose:LPS heptosyltransferase
MPRKLILSCRLSPGDVLMLTAAVRDLHRLYPGRFVTDVRTPCRGLWLHNPCITPLDASDPDVEFIECHYPLIQQSNQEALHFIHGYMQFLSERLGLKLAPTVFAGDIHLAADEKRLPFQLDEFNCGNLPIWIVCAGGKYDFTIKWWNRRWYQAVVDHFKGRLFFVQVGEQGHYHPPLRNVHDLRGKTTLRELVRLVYHADGVLCGVTLHMHLAAAVPLKEGQFSRPAVVIAGGREAPHWEAYPTHQFLHTVGMLPCCATGGCWRSRTVPLGDGDEKDDPRNLCRDVVNGLPRCMDMISKEKVIQNIESRLTGRERQGAQPAEQQQTTKQTPRIEMIR